jgi:hypothetical protein
MKFFTPQGYVALQDLSSDTAMNAADTAWQEAVDRYAAYYDSIAPLLPPCFRKMQSDYYLRDAVVAGMGRRDYGFLIVLRLDTPPNDLLMLEYDLTAEPALETEALPPPYRSKGPVQWLYDEVESTGSAPAAYLHSILLTNGWEVRLPFKDVRVEEAHALIPTPRDGRAGPVAPTMSQPA